MKQVSRQLKISKQANETELITNKLVKSSYVDPETLQLSELRRRSLSPISVEAFWDA